MYHACRDKYVIVRVHVLYEDKNACALDICVCVCVCVCVYVYVYVYVCVYVCVGPTLEK
jgi:hypothetical protein